MKFVNKWSYACACHLASATNENHQKRTVYYYGFFILLSATIKMIALLSVAWIFGALLPAVVVIAVFGSLRSFAGGYHMDTYGKCVLVSMFMFLSSALLARYTWIYWSNTTILLLICITFITGLVMIIKYAPKDTPNKPIIGSKNIRKYKTFSLVYFLLLTIIASLSSYKGNNMVTLCICFAALIEVFTITPSGEKFFDIIKNSLKFNIK